MQAKIFAIQKHFADDRTKHKANGIDFCDKPNRHKYLRK